MTITLHGQRLEILYPQNLALIPELAQRLAQEAAQASERATPARDRSSQATYPAPFTFAVRTA